MPVGAGNMLPAKQWDIPQGPVLVFHRSGSPASQNKVPAAPQFLGIIALGHMKIRNQCIRSRKMNIYVILNYFQSCLNLSVKQISLFKLCNNHFFFTK